MRKAIVLVCAVALVVGSLAFVAQADSGVPTLVSKCKAELASGKSSFDNVGDCVRFFTWADQAKVVEFCLNELDENPTKWTNLGQCVSHWRPYEEK